MSALAATLLVALVVLPAVTGSALVLAGADLDRRAPAVALLAPAVLAGLLLAASLALLGHPVRVATPFAAGADLGLDPTGLAAALLPTLFAVSLLVLVAASASAETATARFGGLMLLFVAAAALTVLATSLPALLLGWEVMGATSAALVGLRWREEHHVSSGLTAFLTTRAADLGLYVALGAAVAGGAGLGLDDLADAAGAWRHVIAAGVLVAALGKAAQLPFSSWLSRAMDGPSPVSALLHSATMVALGGYLLLRVSPLLAVTGWADDAAAWAGALTAVVLGAVALAQRDLKQLLAASTAAQLGFVVLAAGVGSTSAGLAHLLAHAATKALLFLVAGAWLEAWGTRRLRPLAGVARRPGRHRVLGALGVAGLLALAGLAPLSLWATKDLVLAGVREHGLALWVTALVGAALSAAYAVRALVVVLLPPAEHEAGFDAELAGSRRVPARTIVALAPLAAGAVVLGVLALEPVAARLPGPAGPAPGPGELVGSAVLALTVAAAVGWRTRAVARTARAPRPGVDLLRGWVGLEPLTHRLLVRPCLRLADLTARADDAVLDRAVTGLAAGVARGAHHARGADERGLDGLVRGVGHGARRLGGLARRPSGTGQLHHYYLQAVAALAVVLLVLLIAS